MMGISLLQNLYGSGCCCTAEDKGDKDEVFGPGSLHCEHHPALMKDSHEAVSPLLTLRIPRVEGEPIGLDVDMLDGISLKVTRITEGFVKTWNEIHPDSAIHVHDRIIGVNGISLNAQRLAAELHNARVWEMTISRPILVSVIVEHQSTAKFGVDLRPSHDALIIAKISEGFLHDWLEANPGASVQRYDRITKINGFEGSSHKLLRTLHAHSSEAATVLALELVHYDPLPDPFNEFQPNVGKKEA